MHTFARNVSSDGRVLTFASDFVNLVDIDNAFFGSSDIKVRSLDQFEKNVFDVFASAIANGTFSIRAKVCASKVLPQPVGPRSKMFDFANSTVSSTTGAAWILL